MLNSVAGSLVPAPEIFLGFSYVLLALLLCPWAVFVLHEMLCKVAVPKAPEEPENALVRTCSTGAEGATNRPW